MRYDLGHGVYLEPDDSTRDTEFHKRIISTERIQGTRAGNWLVLECGHRSMAFGNLKHARGVVLCTQCRDAKGKS